MASLVERNEENRFEREQKRRKMARNIAMGICATAVVAMITYGISSYINKKFNGYEVIKTISRQDSNTVKYLHHQNGIIKYSKDGASYLDGNGQVVWNGSYDFKNPAIDVCEKYTAIADIGGTEAIVFNGSDSGTMITSTLPILQVQVANQGVTVLVLEDKTSNLMNFYVPTNKGMECKVEIPTNVQADGFPVDIALSNDGQRLVTAYLSIQNGLVQNNVTFYNFDQVGQNYLNRIVGKKGFEQNVVGKVDFVNNETVCVYGEKSFTLYSMVQKAKDIKETVVFDKNIKSTFSSEKYIGFVLENYEETGKYQVVAYDLKGNKILDKQVDYDYDTVYLSGKEIVFYKDLECFILKLNGTEKFKYSFDKNIEYLMPVNNYDKYILINNTNIEIIKLTEEKK